MITLWPKLSRVTYDSLHAALAARNAVDVVVTEDLGDWRKIARAWGVEEELKVGDPAITSPTKGTDTASLTPLLIKARLDDS